MCVASRRRSAWRKRACTTSSVLGTASAPAASRTRTTRNDDSWVLGQVKTVATGLCPDSGVTHPGYVLTLQPQWIAGSQLNVANAITLGAPVRGFDKVTYRVYQAADGNWYLGHRNPAPTRTIQPVVGPLT